MRGNWYYPLSFSMSIFGSFFLITEPKDLLNPLEKENFERKEFGSFHFLSSKRNEKKYNLEKENFAKIFSLLSKNKISDINRSKETISEFIQHICRENSEIKFNYFFQSFSKLIIYESDRELCKYYFNSFEPILECNLDNFKRLLILLWAKANSEENDSYNLSFIINLPMELISSYLKIIRSINSLNETSKENQRMLLLMLVSPFFHYSATADPHNTLLVYDLIKLPCPFDILKNLDSFSIEEIDFTIKALQFAYTLLMIFIDFKVSVSRNVLLQKFLGFSEVTRNSFTYALLLAACDNNNPTLLPKFLRNMSNEIGTTIIESLFTYNTSPLFIMLIKKYGHIFYQFFVSNLNSFSPLFNSSVTPLALDISEVFNNAGVLQTKPNVHIYLQFIINIITRFSTMNAEQQRQFIQTNFDNLIRHIYYVRNLVFEMQHQYLPMSIELLSTTFMLFFREFAKILFDGSASLPFINSTIVDSTLLILNYLISTQIPNKRIVITNRVKAAHKAIIHFIKLNKTCFSANLSITFKPSLLLSTFIAAVHVPLERHALNKLIMLATHSCQIFEMRIASYFIDNLTPTSPKFANDIMNIFFSIYTHFSKQDVPQGLSRQLCNIIYFIYLLSKNNDFIINLSKATLFQCFCSEIPKILSSNLQKLSNKELFNPRGTSTVCLLVISKLIENNVRFLNIDLSVTLRTILSFYSKFAPSAQKAIMSILKAAIEQDVFSPENEKFIPWFLMINYPQELEQLVKVAKSKNFVALTEDQIQRKKSVPEPDITFHWIPVPEAFDAFADSSRTYLFKPAKLPDRNYREEDSD